MANLIGEGFPGFVISQIEKRQSIYGSINRSNAQLEYLNNRNGWCKLVSSVNIDIPVRGIPDTGNELARKYVLFNGTSPTTTGIGGIPGYGLGGTNFGINPMPGITSAVIKTENMGSLKSATIQIKANNRNQFDIIDILYMRLGYSVLLEWGNSNYFNNDGTYVASNPHSLADSFINGSVGTEYQDIFNTINKRRDTSCGNYDAIVGKVVNFTWSFEKDGTYNCTVMIKSMGDIIESLKTNTLLPEIQAKIDIEEEKTEDEEEATEPTSEEVIKSFKNTHEIGKKFYALQQQLAPLIAGNGGISTLYSTQKNIVAFKQTYLGNDGGEGVDQYYIRLGYFLRFVQKSLIPQVDDKQVRLIEIDTDTDSNLIYVLGRQISNNPSICLFKVDVEQKFNLTNEPITFAPGVDEFVYSEVNKNRYGKIMNVYFNMTYILNQLDSLKDTDTGKVSLYDLINCLCEGFNNATGNINQLYPSVDSDRNKIVIRDQTVCPDIKDLLDKQGKSTSLATFDVYGYYYNNSNNASSAGFIRDLSFQTTVSPNLATMITIGATSNGYIPGQDSTALSRMNAGLTDRFKKKVNLEQTSPLSASKESLFEDYKESILSYQSFVSQLGGSTPTWNQEAIDAFSNAASSFYEYDQAKQTLANSTGTADSKSSPNGGFLPFDLQLTLDGLSGMKIYQKYTIDTAFLPSNYPTSLNFLIKGITNTISNNEWTTTLESFAIPANPFGSEVGQSTVAIASGNSRDASRGTEPTSGWPYYSNNDAVPPNIAAPSKGTPPTNTRNVTIGSTIVKEYLPVLNSTGGKTKGLKLLAIAMTNQEGFYKGTRSYRTNNPGNIGNTDAGGNNIFKTLKSGIETQLKYIEDVAAGKKSAYPVGKNKTIPPYYSPEIAKNSKSYQLTPYLPGYKFTPYTGTLEQFVKIYATGARGGNTYLSTIMSFYKKNGFNVTEKTTIADLIKLNSTGPIIT